MLSLRKACAVGGAVLLAGVGAGSVSAPVQCEPTLNARVQAVHARLAALESRTPAEPPRLRVGGVAASPPPVLLRERPGTGIGQRTRFMGDPAERAAKFPGSNDMIPTLMARPREGFPLLVQPATAAEAAAESEGGRPIREWAASARTLLDEQLRAHGAVLLHGLPIRTAEDFNAFVEGLNYPSMDTHGASERKREAKAVFGASDDVPPSHTLHPHNEQAYLGSDESPSYPRKIFFCCLREPHRGGETPIVCNRRVTRDIQRERPELWRRLREHGVMYVQTLKSARLDDPMVENLGGEQSWQKAFNTTSREEVETQCKERGYRLRWLEDGAAELASVRQAAVEEYPGSGNDVWFNQASNVFSFVPCFGDGEPLDDDTLEYLNAVYWRHAVGFQWTAGDVLAIDNEMAMHARTSFEPPRKIVVGFSKV